MRIPLTEQLLREAAQFELRSACEHCFHFVAAEARCAHEWPSELQRLWPLDPNISREAGFCKEFELR